MQSARKITLVMLVVFTLLLLMNLITSIQAQNDPTLTIKVYTKDEKPLANAYVELKDQNGTKIDVKKTGSDGKASFSVTGDKLYNAYVYYPAGYQIGSALDINVTIMPDINITVDVISKWTIYVYDKKERDPVSNAKVFLAHKTNNTIKYSGSTDSSGKVEFGPIPSDSNYDITVEFKGNNYSLGAKSIPSEGATKLTLPLYRVTLSIVDRKGSPVEGVDVELREGLDKSPAAAATSDSNGLAIMRLIPTNTEYYVVARLKGIIVYTSSEKEIKVLNDDVSEEITVNAIRLNITVMDYDGEDILRNYTLTGKLFKDGREIGSASSENGVIRFGHTPFESYDLKIMLGEMTVYSGKYEVKVESAEGAVKAWFYDVKIRVNASAIVNASITRSLVGELRAPGLRFEFQTKDWEANIRNVPKFDKYTASLLYLGKEVFRAEGLRINEENQVLWLNITGRRLNITTINLDDEHVSADIIVVLEGVGRITSFKTDADGHGSPGRLLPLTYRLEAYVDGMPVGVEMIDLTADKSVVMRLSLRNIYFKVFDKDGETALGNVSLMLTHGKFSRSGRYLENGTLLVEDLPLGEYCLTVKYYGFKVLEDYVEISPENRLIELKAPGVLDLELVFLDSDKKPLDQGRAVVSFSGYEFEGDIGADGRAVFKNLPNITLEVTAFYRGVRLQIEPSEIDLVRDDMKAVITCSVHSFEAEVLRGDGKPLDEGLAMLYVNDMLLETYNLAEKNKILARLPEGDLRVEIRYRGRGAGLFNTYLERSMMGLAIYSTVYPVEILVRNPDRGVVSGARLIVEDGMGVIAEAVSGGDGIIRLLLPAAENYNATLKIDNETYSFRFTVEKSKSLSFLRPAPYRMGFEMTVTASAINLIISGYAISRLPRGRQRPRRGPRRARRRVPRL